MANNKINPNENTDLFHNEIELAKLRHNGIKNMGFDSKKLEGKIEAIDEARNEMAVLMEVFGGRENFPSSVMRAERRSAGVDDNELDEAVGGSKRTDSKDRNGRGYVATAVRSKRDQGVNLAKMPDEYAKSVMISGGYGTGVGALSAFPQNVGRSIVLMYSEPGDTVFDPFAGHNSRMDLCVKEGRHYIGCDLSTEFMKFNKKRAETLKRESPAVKIQLHHTDSRKVPVASNSADFTITSPPYWDIEYYGDEPEQLGKCKSYDEFLDGLQLVMNENFRVLRPGSYASWHINDFRKKGKMYFYHVDTIRLGENAGFDAHDIMVVDLGHGIRDCFPNQTLSTKILPKRHEFAVIFRKPEIKTKTSRPKKN